MRFRIFLIILVTFCLVASYKSQTLAQAPTFGPICEGTPAPNVTCVPPTSTPRPTTTPRPPVSGATETTTALLGFSVIFLLAGATSFVFSHQDNEVTK